MDVINVSLEAVGTKMEHFATKELPEFAFVGRSNVGKSSLINAMINRKSLARTSQNPGKTRTINFYNIEELLYFVDLPGYGYAKTSKKESEKWGEMIETYLTKRTQLKTIIMLIDSRHEPMENDLTMFEWLKFYNYEMIVVATKIDKLKRSQIPKHISAIRKALGVSAEQKIIPFSSETKAGKDELWACLEKYVEISEA